MNFWGYRKYVPVARRQASAAKETAKLRKQGRVVSPVVIEGRKIATSFWGKAWCDNLERYSDFENRLPRGRTYVRNGSVVDLQIARGTVVGLVAGSQLYRVEIAIEVAAAPRWKAICCDCAGSVGSIVELLQGKLSKHVMERVCREADGLFPAPKEIVMSCSCLDWADMCKHVAATLYGVGARLDRDPDLLFAMRGVDRSELVSAGADLSITEAAAKSERVLAGDDVAALFGLQLDAPPSLAAATVKAVSGDRAGSARATRRGRARLDPGIPEAQAQGGLTRTVSSRAKRKTTSARAAAKQEAAARQKRDIEPTAPKKPAKRRLRAAERIGVGTRRTTKK